MASKSVRKAQKWVRSLMPKAVAERCCCSEGCRDYALKDKPNGARMVVAEKRSGVWREWAEILREETDGTQVKSESAL